MSPNGPSNEEEKPKGLHWLALACRLASCIAGTPVPHTARNRAINTAGPFSCAHAERNSAGTITPLQPQIQEVVQILAQELRNPLYLEPTGEALTPSPRESLMPHEAGAVKFRYGKKRIFAGEAPCRRQPPSTRTTTPTHRP